MRFLVICKKCACTYSCEYFYVSVSQVMPSTIIIIKSQNKVWEKVRSPSFGDYNWNYKEKVPLICWLLCCSTPSVFIIFSAYKKWSIRCDETVLNTKNENDVQTILFIFSLYTYCPYMHTDIHDKGFFYLCATFYSLTFTRAYLYSLV